MSYNKIVLRYVDGRTRKGTTGNFSPDREKFHVTPAGATPESMPLEVHTGDLKAIFFVREFEGNREYQDHKFFDAGLTVIGRKVKVVFNDGEVLVGSTTSYNPDRQGFFINPADPKSNIERCFVVKKATSKITII
ncbi:MAG: hypothetical protein CVU72_04470 [Deltaproteobacteria bacterium HGW-Deltaproteobacteria-7]|jgi:hypothetical protein|nr:MAG: hypothetical protein CVU72_04470 [Deltaproteobacteria bacterium HGW-Deltaproteobacteria-7]PKN18534.1 MAG: hypothetical protein CVU71_13705 [Deltaproteobacteria bacterium HGW-Deltaproteobacteria-6]